MEKALLVIDLQKDYFPGGKFPLWNTDVVLQNIEGAIGNELLASETIQVVDTRKFVTTGSTCQMRSATEAIP